MDLVCQFDGVPCGLGVAGAMLGGLGGDCSPVADRAYNGLWELCRGLDPHGRRDCRLSHGSFIF
jgi:hypothetical protein